MRLIVLLQVVNDETGAIEMAAQKSFGLTEATGGPSEVVQYMGPGIGFLAQSRGFTALPDEAWINKDLESYGFILAKLG